MTEDTWEDRLLIFLIQIDEYIVKRWIASGFGPDLYSHSAPTG